MMSETATPNESSDPAGGSVRDALYRAALGPVHAEHYLPAFARFDERGRAGPVWNLPAFVFSLAWLLYRQLWGAAGEFLLLFSAWGAVSGALWWLSDAWPLGVRVGLVLSLLVPVLLVPGLFGTALLHAQVRQRMIRAVEQSATVAAACELLQSRGHELRRRGAWGVVGLLLAGGALAWTGWTWIARPGDQPSPALPLPDQPVLPTPVAPEPVAAELAESAAPVVSGASEATASDAATSPLATGATSPAATPPTDTSQTSDSTPAVAMPAEVRTRVQGFGVSVGLFAVAGNAERVTAALAGAGLPVISDPIESSRGPMTRVRVGPFETRGEAQAAAGRVRELGLDARVYAP